MNWTPLTDAEEAEYQQLIQRANAVQRYGLENQKRAQAGLNVFEPHTRPGALAEAGGEMLPEMGLSLGLPELRLAHAAYWAGVSYLKARGSGASKAQAIGDAATAVAMLGASAPLSPLAAEAGEAWRTLAKGATRGALGFGMGSALGAMRPGATPQSALSQGLQFGLMNLAGGGGGESEERTSVTPREPAPRGQELPALEQNRAGETSQQVYDRYTTSDGAPAQPERAPGPLVSVSGDRSAADADPYTNTEQGSDAGASAAPVSDIRESEAGLTAAEIEAMRRGEPPKGYQVHHKLSLDDTGANDWDNLILVKEDPFHWVLTGHQISWTNKLTAATPGEASNSSNTMTVLWPEFKKGVIVYGSK